MARQHKPVSWLQFGAIAALVVILFAVLMVREQQKLTRLQAQENTLEAEMNLMQQSYEELAQQLERVGTDGHVENAARKTYGYIREGEIIFAFQYPEMLNGYTQEEYQYIIEQMR